MTINIALQTTEGLVLACDSISSQIGYFLHAFGPQTEIQQDGTYIARYKPEQVVTQVTNSLGGVTKFFQLHGGETPVAAITAGLAKLSNRSMNSCALEFFRQQELAHNWRDSVGSVADAFLKFMRSKYDEHYANSQIPQEFRDGPVFLIGGYGINDYLPSLYRIDIQKNLSNVEFAPGEFGVAWAGQSDAVERLIRGYDVAIRIAVEKAVTDGIRQIREALGSAMQQAVQKLVDDVGPEKVADMRVEAPESKDLVLPWDAYQAHIDCGNLPLQDGIDFAAFLVNIQSGRAKFSEGVPTVGGRTHIGVITKQDGFKMIDEAPLVHRNTGFI